MTADPLALLTEVDRATGKLLRTASALNGDDAVAEASALPGWTRGHVLTHLARNADSLVNLLTWARTGVVTPQYPSTEHREQGIAAGAGRPLTEQITDLRESAGRFTGAAQRMPADGWSVVLDLPDGARPAAYVVWARLREVEVHHADLAAGYTLDDWSEAFGHRLLHEVVADLAGRDGVPAMALRPVDCGHALGVGDPAAAPVISGTAAALAAWLIGRSTGAGLTVTPHAVLPTLATWR